MTDRFSWPPTDPAVIDSLARRGYTDRAIAELAMPNVRPRTVGDYRKKHGIEASLPTRGRKRQPKGELALERERERWEAAQGWPHQDRVARKAWGEGPDFRGQDVSPAVLRDEFAGTERLAVPDHAFSLTGSSMEFVA